MRKGKYQIKKMLFNQMKMERKRSLSVHKSPCLTVLRAGLKGLHPHEPNEQK